MREITKKYIGLILVGLLCFIVGYCVGFISALSFLITKAVNFLQSQGVDFKLSAQQIADLIYKYQHLIVTGGSGTI